MNPKKYDVPEKLLSGLLASYQKPEDLIGEKGLLKELTKLLLSGIPGAPSHVGRSYALHV